MMVPTTLFKSVRSSSHEQSVTTCMNMPVNNRVQAGQLNHVQGSPACQQTCSSWPAQPCSWQPVSNHVQADQHNHVHGSLSTTMFKLASTTMFKLASTTMFKPAVNRQKQAVHLYVGTLCAQLLACIHNGKRQTMSHF